MNLPKPSVKKIQEDPEVKNEDFENNHEEQRRSICLQQPKRQKTRTLTLDKISSLPDLFLVQILSFLPLKESVRTGILSKRWRYLWTSLSTLSFHNNDYANDKIAKFVSWIDRNLVFCHRTYIRKFEVSFRYNASFAPDLCRWLRFVTTKNLQELALHLSCFSDHSYKLPLHLYNNSSLTGLSLANCILMPNGVVRWESLRSLSLKNVSLTDVMIGKILAGTPVLEFLELKAFHGIDYLDVNSGNLKELIVYFWNESGEDSWLVISAPHLQSLHILGRAHGRKLRLTNVSSLAKARLDFSWDTTEWHKMDEYYDMFTELMKSLQHVEELKLGSWCIEMLSTVKLEVPLPLTISCKRLTLCSSFEPRDIDGIARLLLHSPLLETLVVNLAPDLHHKSIASVYSFDWSPTREENFWTSLNINSQNFLLHLKIVKFVGLGNRHCKLVLPLMMFLLCNARKLENMVIDSCKLSNKICAGCQVSPDFVQVVQKLLSFPRASPHAVILFS